MYLMQNPKRILIRCPPVPCEIWSKIGNESTRLSEGIRFAVSLLGLQQECIRPYSIESVTLIGTLLRFARDERLGRLKITLENVDTSVLLWMQRKGLTTKLLEQIEKLAGSLTRGFLMILHSLPRRTHASTKRPLDPVDPVIKNAKRVRCHEPFDKKAFQEVKKVIQDAVSRVEEAYKTALQNLPPEKPLEGDQEIDGLQDIMHPGPAVTLEKVRQLISSETSGGPSEPLSSSDLYPDQDADPEDCHILELEPLCKRAVDLGLLDPEVPNVRGKRLKFRGHVWQQEVGKFRDKEYTYQLNPSRHNLCISISYCRISFLKDEDLGDGTIWVKVEVNPPGQRHAKCYATDALDSDPASRLSFRIRYKNSKGEPQERYARAGGRQSVYAANTLHDIIVDDKPKEVIAKTPRRFLYFTSESRIPEGLKRFVGGGYTEDN